MEEAHKLTSMPKSRSSSAALLLYLHNKAAAATQGTHRPTQTRDIVQNKQGTSTATSQLYVPKLMSGMQSFPALLAP